MIPAKRRIDLWTGTAWCDDRLISRRIVRNQTLPFQSNLFPIKTYWWYCFNVFYPLGPIFTRYLRWSVKVETSVTVQNDTFLQKKKKKKKTLDKSFPKGKLEPVVVRKEKFWIY